MNFSPGRILILVVGSLLCMQVSCGTPHITPQRHEVKRTARATQRPYIIAGKRYYPVPSAEGYKETGFASWYGGKFHGRKTSNGEVYDMYAETAAHKTLPMGTMLLVKNLDNGKNTVVRINDRGPFVKGRIIDLSYTAAQKIGMVQHGTAKITITALGEDSGTSGTLKNNNALPGKLKHQDFNKGKFYVQVGAFEHLKNARILAKKFANMGRNVVIQQFPAAGIQLYRVMVFGSTALDVAKRYESYLEKHGFPNALIIAR